MLRLEVNRVLETREQLLAFIEAIDDFGPLWDAYGDIMVSTEAEWFATLGEGTWPPLARTTVRDKALSGFPPDPLIRTGELFASLTNPEQAMQIGQGRSTLGTFTRKAMTWGTDVSDARGREYAHFHQNVDPVTGEPAGYPPRPPERQVIPWPLPVQTKAAMESANLAFVEDAIQRSGLGE